MSSFTTIARKTLYKLFYTISQKKYISKDKNKNYIYSSLFKTYDNRKELQSGIEGVVFKASLNVNTDNFIIIKCVNLKNIMESKQINKAVLNKTADEINELFYKITENFTMPSLIEIMSFTLTNQLVFQKKCPHFALNYYWEYKNNHLILYNEYINCDTLEKWSKKTRSEFEWTNIFMQIALSVISMQKYFNMIHGDLHPSNVLIQKIQPGGFWCYIVNDKEYYLPNLGWICLINDFGFTTIPNKMYVKFHYDQTINKMNQHALYQYDFNNVANAVYNNNCLKGYSLEGFIHDCFTLQKPNIYVILDELYNIFNTHFVNYYKMNLNENRDFIEIYNMNEKLNKKLLPTNFIDFVTF